MQRGKRDIIISEGYMNNFNAFFNQSPITLVSKGQVILQQGYEPAHAYILKSGIVKVTSFTSNGEEKLLAFKVAGDLIPTHWVFGQSRVALHYYQAYTDCVLYVLDRDAILQRVESDNAFARFILDQHIAADLDRQLRVEALEQSRAHLKLLYTFRHLALTYGMGMNQGFIKIDIPFTQQELANFVGLTRETTIAALRRLRRDNLIRSDHRYYVVNTGVMSMAIDDEFDPGVRRLG